jgi:hypothetical protein
MRRRTAWLLPAFLVFVTVAPSRVPAGDLDAKRRALEAQRSEVLARLEAVEKKAEALAGPEVAALDELLADLRGRLAKVPRAVSDIPSPANGYQSAVHPQPEAPAWVQVDLGRVLPVDEIRLIPARPTDVPDSPGFGFPPRLMVALCDDPAFPASATDVVETAVRPDGREVEDEPYVIRPEGRSARYVRVAASRLWKRRDDCLFALAELEVISDSENVALDSIEAGRWSRAALVDGFDSRGKRPAAADPSALRRAELRFRIRDAERDRRKRAEAAMPARLRLDRDALKARLRALDESLRRLAATGVAYSAGPGPILVLNQGAITRHTG